ncbi:LysR family transcriptional regulator [Pararhodobacter marinus]|nr:LysR family transcriptional regulator [Pararhodobacter marinus]
MNDLDLLRPTLAFATVVETGSFRAGADRLALSPPYVSQMVSDLEARLGRQLLYRSTRRIALTAEGEAFLPHARALAEAFAEGLETVRDAKRRLTGRLRISAPTVLASPAFARVVRTFAADHPGIALEIDMDDRVDDPVAAQVDLALRIGDPGKDPRLARKLFTTRGVVCCAPELAGKLIEPQDLAELTWLRSPATPTRLILRGPDGRDHAAEPGRQMVINNAALIRTLLQDGGSFALLPEFTVREALKTARLGIACAAWSIPEVGVHALYTERRTALTNARAFVDCLQGVLASRRT